MDEGIIKELIFSNYQDSASSVETDMEVKRIKEEKISDDEEPATNEKKVFPAGRVKIECSLHNFESKNTGVCNAELLEVNVHEENMEEQTFCDDKTLFTSVELDKKDKSTNEETISFIEESTTHSEMFLPDQVEDPLGNCDHESNPDLGNQCSKRELSFEDNEPKLQFTQEKMVDDNESGTHDIDGSTLSDSGSIHSSAPAHPLQGAEFTQWIQTGEKPFQCDLCGQKFTLSSSLKNHLAVHTGEKPFECDVCGKKFALKKFLQSHRAIHTKEKPFQCDVCGRKFLYSRSWKNHQMIHTGEKPFQCDVPVCGKRFSLKKLLLSHQAVHTGVKPYQCDICGRTFSLRSSLRTHLAVHTGEKPFQCDLCGQTFSQLNILKGHQTVHSEEKPFQCGECERRFPRKRALKKHLLIHTREKPFQCPECQQKFLYKSHLEKHQSEHGRDTAPT